MKHVARQKKVLTIFATRPEVIKLAPIIHELDGDGIKVFNVASGQHKEILYPFINLFGVRIDCDLQILQLNQTPNQVCSRVLAELDPVLSKEKPALLLVQGDTTTALAGALGAFYQQIPIAHVEAGLRSGNSRSPYPEEMNRRLISRLATYHFAATSNNRNVLLAEGVDRARIFVTGNPVVDSLHAILKGSKPSLDLAQVLEATKSLKRVILTTHRRESFGTTMVENLNVIRQFTDQHEDLATIFPVHPNPAVAVPAQEILGDHPRIHLIPPLNYSDFIVLLSHAWIIVSDSGGVQEEVPTLGKPLLILRENTERSEALESGVAKLVGGDPKKLAKMLKEAHQSDSWVYRVRTVSNPFGRGDSARQICKIIVRLLNTEETHENHQQAANA